MYRLDPFHHPSEKFLEDLSTRFHAFCEEPRDWQKRQKAWDDFQKLHDNVRKWRKTEGWFGPPSTSYHFVDDELFSGFTNHDEDYRSLPTHTLRPWERPSRKEVEEYLSTVKHVSFPNKTGLFGKTLNKFIHSQCRSTKAPPTCIDLPSSTMEKPIYTRIVDTADSDDFKHLYPIYLVGHETVLKNKDGCFCDPIFGRAEKNWPLRSFWRHQLICIDITFVGPVGWLGDRERNAVILPRFYDCVFTGEKSWVALCHETIMVNCRAKVVIIGAGITARFSNCQFDQVKVLCGRVLAKGCEFGTLELFSRDAAPLYFLEDCTVGETKRSEGKWMEEGIRLDSFKWMNTEERCKSEFESMEETFDKVDFDPDD